MKRDPATGRSLVLHGECHGEQGDDGDQRDRAIVNEQAPYLDRHPRIGSTPTHVASAMRSSNIQTKRSMRAEAATRIEQAEIVAPPDYADPSPVKKVPIPVSIRCH